MKFIPYLDFDGQAREAFDFYAKALNGKITMRMTYGESPMAKDMPPETHGRVMHSQLETSHSILMGADAPPNTATSKGCVNIDVENPAEADRVFKALSEGGVVTLPIAETFWAHRFGMFTDRFGKAWMVNCLKSMG